MGDIAVGSREVRPLLRKYRQPMYDEEQIGAGVAVQTLALFANRRGAQDNSGTVKTARDTNVLSSGNLGAKMEFYLVGFNVRLDWDLLAVDVQSAAPNAATQEFFVIQQIMNDSLFQFQFGRQTDLIELPMDRIPQGCGPNGVIDNQRMAAAAEISHIMQVGIPSVREFYDVRLQKRRPRHIQPDQNFTCTISWPNGAITVGTVSGAEYYRIMVYGIGIMLSSL